MIKKATDCSDSIYLKSTSNKNEYLSDRKAFTLIELLVVITILAILAGAALPYVQNYVKDSKISKAKTDLEEIKRALAIYETREGVYKANTVSQLTGRYLNKSPIDPWGRPYSVATDSGIVFSYGPDRASYTPDDISVNYQPPLALVQVKWVDANHSGAVDTQNTPDYLKLYFSRKIDPTSDAVANPSTADKYFSWTSANDISSSLNWASFTLAISGDMITLPVKDGKIDVFGPGSDTISVIDGDGLRDVSPVKNKCITSQTVVISSQ